MFHVKHQNLTEIAPYAEAVAIRNGKIHLITIYKMHKKQWEKHYEKTN